MMSHHIERYTITLQTIGPVFIGSGATYGKKETLFDVAYQKVHVPDLPKMFSWLQKQNLLQAYENFLLGYDNDFGWWLRQQGMSYNQYKEWISYTLDAQDADLATKEKKQIQCFVKDAYGLPYIPGSSLKGALRTALLIEAILKKKADFSGVAQEVRNKTTQYGRVNFKREDAALNEKAFRTRNRNPERRGDAVNDSLAGLIISDSKPLSCEDLMLCKKLDVRTDGTANSLNVLRECLKPNTIISFDVSIDTTATTLTGADLQEAINTFLQYYNKVFDCKFGDSDSFAKDVIYLGGGVGYVSKTATYALLGENSAASVARIIESTLNFKAKKEHGHSQDAKLGVSPHMMKRTRYRTKRISMGACKITIARKDAI